MFVENIVPVILIASTASPLVQDASMLFQCCMLGITISTVIQLCPIRIGNTWIDSGLPYTMGPIYVSLPACLSITDNRGIPYASGVQIVTGVVAVSYGALPKKMSFFSPLTVTGTIIITIGISTFNLAISNIAGGTSPPGPRVPINQTVGVPVVLVVLGFDMFGKDLPKVTAIPIGMTAGYVLSVILGSVGFPGIGEVAWSVFLKPFVFGVKFDLRCTLTFVLLYFVITVQMIEDFNVSCMGGLDHEPAPDEIGDGATVNGVTSVVSAALNGFPTATYSQDFDIVAPTKVCSRSVILISCGTLFLAGLYPEAGVVLSTIPNYVAGGGTVVVSAMVTIPDIELLAEAGYSNRNYLTIGVPLVFGPGAQLCKGASAQFPVGITTTLEKNSVILASLLAIILSLVFPEDPVQAEESTGKAQ